MAAFNINIDGGFFVTTDALPVTVELIRNARAETTFEFDPTTEKFQFFWKIVNANGTINSSILGNANNTYLYSDLNTVTETIDGVPTVIPIADVAALCRYLGTKVVFFFNPDPTDVNIVGSENQNIISIANSTTALLGAGATFTGAWEDVIKYTTAGAAIQGSNISGGTLYFDLSPDGGVTSISVPFIVGNVTFAVPRILNIVETHVRIRYVNGLVAQTGTWSLQTKFSTGQQMALLSSIDGVINGETPTQVVRAVLAGQDDDDVFRNVRTTRAGDMAVSISDPDEGFHAIVTPGGAVKTSEQTNLVGEPFGGAALNTTKWLINIVGSGSQDASGAGELTMDTGVTPDSVVQIQSTDIARFIPANYNTTHHAVTIPDGASYAADNSRKWGAFDATNPSGNGIYYEIDDGDWYLAHCLNGVVTRTIQASWTGAGKDTFPTNSINANVYEIEYNAGSIIYRVNGNVVHRETLLATPFANDIHFPAGMTNTNYNGSIIDVSLKIRTAAIYTLGKGLGQDRPFFINGPTAGTLIKTSPGHLGKVIFARAGGGGGSATVAIYDDLSAVPATQVGQIELDRDDTIPIEYDFTFNMGLFVVISGAGTLATTITFD